MSNKTRMVIQTLVIGILVFGFVGEKILSQGKKSVLEVDKNLATKKLSQVKVAVLYENITDGVLIGRSLDETINILKETRTDIIFRSFWKWEPIINSPDSIPPELLELTPKGTTLEQVAAYLRITGHYYQELKRWISVIKKEIPDIIFVGAIPTQTLGRIEYNPITSKIWSMEETWGMALDPQKWNITNNGSPVTKEQFQSWWYGVHPCGGKIDKYDWQKVPAYFPDITNPKVHELILSWAKKQIDCGADAIWIDMLHHQATLLSQMTGDVNHIAVKESIDDASKIVDEIHTYGDSIGRYIHVGSWHGPFVIAEMIGLNFPYTPPNLDFITTSPLNQEIMNKKLDSIRWTKEMQVTKKKYVDIPFFAFIDWGFDSSQTVMFSQKLSNQEQTEVLKTFDASFTKMGINFIYPLHGGYMGRGEITTKLAWGKYRTYDALAPEFQTYQTIKELAQKKSTTEMKEKSGNLPATLTLEQNYPNPFSERTTIRFGIRDLGLGQKARTLITNPQSLITLKVFDLLGREVATLFEGKLKPGSHEIQFDIHNSSAAGGFEISSGLYYYQLHTQNFSQTRLMQVLR